MSFLSTFKEFIKTLLWPLLFVVGQVLITGLFMLIYMLQHPNFNFDDPNSNSILLEYMNEQTLFILLIECVIFMPIFYFVYKKYRMDNVVCNVKSIFKIALISFLLSGILNFLIILIKHYMFIDVSNSSITFSIILATGIIGPIFEELLFRGIVYGRFLHIFKEKTAFYLSIFVFAFSHTGGIFQILFATIIGCFLTFVYRKYHDIRLSMLAHITVNITSILISPFILLLF